MRDTSILTVGQLKTIIEKIPDNMPVIICSEHKPIYHTLDKEDAMVIDTPFVYADYAEQMVKGHDKYFLIGVL